MSPTDNDWKKRLRRNKTTGGLQKSIGNVALILENAPDWRGALVLDLFQMRILITKACPAEPAFSGAPIQWSDVHSARTAAWFNLNREFHINVASGTVSEAVGIVADRNKVDSLKERIMTLRWDGVHRLDECLIRYFGAEDTPAIREISRRFLIGAVARALQPGVKFDTALVLESPQGRGKSTAARVLSLGLFTDELSDLRGKDSAIQLAGVWIVELCELDALSKSESSTVKAFLSRSVDRYRPPFGRHAVDVPRRCVFIGTVNHDDYLRDETGGRRWLPVKCGSIDIEGLKRDVEAIWAEAREAFLAGERFWIAPEHLAGVQAEQRKRFAIDAWSEKIEAYIALKTEVTVSDVLQHCLVIEVGRWTPTDQNRVSKILKSLGWFRYQRREGKKRIWVYVPTSPHAPNAGDTTPDDATGSGNHVTTVTTTSPNMGRSEQYVLGHDFGEGR